MLHCCTGVSSILPSGGIAYANLRSLNASAGQPSTFSCDWAIDRACEVGNKYTLPENLRCHLLIYRFIARVNTVMTESAQSPTGYPPEAESCVLMAILEKDLGDLERQISCKMNGLFDVCRKSVGSNLLTPNLATHSILLSMACLQLRTYYFFMSAGSDTRKQGLIMAYAASMALISKSAEADHKWNFMKFAPNGFLQMLTISAMVLMKITNSSYAKYIDVGGARRSFNTVLAMLRNSSVEDNDLHGRVSKIVAQLWSLHRTRNLRKEEEPSIHLKTRWGASLLHDSLWLWREEFGGQKAPPPPLDTELVARDCHQRTMFTGTILLRCLAFLVDDNS